MKTLFQLIHSEYTSTGQTYDELSTIENTLAELVALIVELVDLKMLGEGQIQVR